MPMGCISLSIELVKVKPWLQQAITPRFITCGMPNLKVGRINLLASTSLITQLREQTWISLFQKFLGTQEQQTSISNQE
jgi:hypothetical protein